MLCLVVAPRTVLQTARNNRQTRKGSGARCVRHPCYREARRRQRGCGVARVPMRVVVFTAPCTILFHLGSWQVKPLTRGSDSDPRPLSLASRTDLRTAPSKERREIDRSNTSFSLLCVHSLIPFLLLSDGVRQQENVAGREERRKYKSAVRSSARLPNS